MILPGFILCRRDTPSAADVAMLIQMCPIKDGNRFIASVTETYRAIVLTSLSVSAVLLRNTLAFRLDGSRSLLKAKAHI